MDLKLTGKIVLITGSAGSEFGVHRFGGENGDIGEQGAQVIGGELVAYMKEMGSSPELYPLMTRGAPDARGVTIHMSIS
jgi:hypothetical protein